MHSAPASGDIDRHMSSPTSPARHGGAHRPEGPGLELRPQDCSQQKRARRLRRGASGHTVSIARRGEAVVGQVESCLRSMSMSPKGPSGCRRQAVDLVGSWTQGEGRAGFRKAAPRRRLNGKSDITAPGDAARGARTSTMYIIRLRALNKRGAMTPGATGRALTQAERAAGRRPAPRGRASAPPAAHEAAAERAPRRPGSAAPATPADRWPIPSP